MLRGLLLSQVHTGAAEQLGLLLVVGLVEQPRRRLLILAGPRLARALGLLRWYFRYWCSQATGRAAAGGKGARPDGTASSEVPLNLIPTLHHYICSTPAGCKHR
jgi:hypothetical protein